MKILYATMQFGRGYGQGTERYVAMLSEGLGRRGHEVLYLAGDPERRGPELPLGAPVGGDERWLSFPTRGPMSVRGLGPRELIPVLNRLRPDVVHLANPAHIGLGIAETVWSMKIPLIVTAMDYWWVCPKHTLRYYRGGICDGQVSWGECLRCIAAGHHRRTARVLARLPVLGSLALPPLSFARWMLNGMSPVDVYRWTKRQAIAMGVLDQADAVIFPSATARGLLGPRMSHGRFHAIPYGLDARWFGGREKRVARRPTTPQEVTVGFAGALEPHKGPHLLLAALRQLGWSWTRVRIAGTGSDEKYVRGLREESRGLNVEFAGFLPDDAMPAFLGGLDVLVAPSIWPENLPIVVLEAQALGVPVLGSGVGGIAEMIDQPENVFEVNSSLGLARCLARWLERGKNGNSPKVSTADEMVERTLAVYERTLRER